MKKYQGRRTLEILKNAKNYNNWIAQTFLRYLVTPILEIGAGTGNLSSHFLTHTPYVLSDIDATLLASAKKIFQKKEGVSFLALDITKPPPPKYKNHFASVLGINVLEHIEDDRKALENVHKMLKKEGKLLLLVPAKQKAYTRFDQELGHFRRYEKAELVEKVEAANFVIEDVYYFNLIGLISWVIRDKVERKNIQMKPYQIALFDSIVPLLRFFEDRVHPPVGVSLILIARKNK